MFCIVLLFSPAASKFLGNYTKSCAKIQNNVYIKYNISNYPLDFDRNVRESKEEKYWNLI